MPGIIAVAILALLLALPGPTALAQAWDGLWRYLPGSQHTDAGALASAQRYIASLPDAAGTTRLAAEASDVGHWVLANRAGETFTAAAESELATGLRSLAPEAAKPGHRLEIHLTAATVFRHAAQLAKLPADVALHLYAGDRTFALTRQQASGEARWLAAVAPGLLVDAPDATTFEEVRWQLERRLTRASIRTLALEPGAAVSLPLAPEIAPGGRQAQPDAVDPGHVADAIRRLQGQLVLASGRLHGEHLHYSASSGGEGVVKHSELLEAAARGDVDLISIATTSSRQPGTRTWLWQRAALANAEKAAGGATIGAFLHMLAGDRTLIVQANRAADGRVMLAMRHAAENGSLPGGALTEVIVGRWSELVAETAGALTVTGLKASLTSRARRSELGRRLVPGVPSLVQLGYLALLAAGGLGWPVVTRWWRQMWPAEQVAEYGNRTGYELARGLRGLLLLVLFLPLAGLPALLVRLADATRRLPSRRDSRATSAGTHGGEAFLEKSSGA